MFRSTIGIRTRIIAIALVPSVALFAIGVGAAGYLLYQGESIKDWSAVLEEANLQARDMIDAVQQERLLSLTSLANPGASTVDLRRARQRLDTALGALSSFESALTRAGIEQIADAAHGFDAIKDQLPVVRLQIDAGKISIADAAGPYSALLEGVALGTQIIGKSAPNSHVAFEFANEVRVLRATEAVSRGNAIAVVALSGVEIPDTLTAEYRNLVGYYRAEIPKLAGDLGGTRGDSVNSLIAAPVWKQLSVMEEHIIDRSIYEKSGTATPSAAIAAWHRDIEQAGSQLLTLWQSQNEHANRVTKDDAAQTSRNSALAGAWVLLLAVMAFLASLWLANRVTRRLKRLRTETLTLVGDELPASIARLGHDSPTETTAQLDFGQDEVGEVAAAFNQAHGAALAAAAAEVRTREGVRAIFLHIAHRSQLVMHRQLAILDEAEQRQQDPALLDTFFKLDHLATRERRNAESLVILAGGQPSRQWRRPVPLLDLVRSAVSESSEYKRVNPFRVPDVSVVGGVVADLIHLIAELVDNATEFSPSQSAVEITGMVVGKGVAVEIKDQGVGMRAAELQQANEMLQHVPEFGAVASSGDVRLGLFVVATLSRRHDISIRLTDSDHGGIKAIVLIPHTVLATDPPSIERSVQLADRPVRTTG
ncbi:sensor histidine kinase [Nocardia asteroides]|uniref:sensor histidine kinase n=1 Tax=Nocardia asteroides TaxID=1824 RepID=UPI0033FFB437